MQHQNNFPFRPQLLLGLAFVGLFANPAQAQQALEERRQQDRDIQDGKKLQANHAKKLVRSDIKRESAQPRVSSSNHRKSHR